MPIACPGGSFSGAAAVADTRYLSSVDLDQHIVIRAPRHGDGRQMAALYRAAFSDRLPGRDVWPRFGFDDSLVAALGDRIVGLGCFEDAKSDLDPLLDCLAPLTRQLLDPLGRNPIPGEPPALVIEAPVGVAPVRGPGDRVFSAVAVDRAFRRQGIGRALAIRRLERAVNDGVSQVFVHAIDGSGSRELYERLGFTPLVRFALHYRDGAGMTLLYRRL